jgi:hypothetical protein
MFVAARNLSRCSLAERMSGNGALGRRICRESLGLARLQKSLGQRLLMELSRGLLRYETVSNRGF